MNTITLADFQICISVPLKILFKLWEHLFRGTPPSGSKGVSEQTNTCSFFYMVIFSDFIEQFILIFLDIILNLFGPGLLGLRNAGEWILPPL